METSELGALEIFFLFIPVFLGLLLSAVTILMLAAMWRIFTKANEPGWASLIPIFNIVVLLRINKQPMWLAILFLIPYVNAIVSIIVTWRLGEIFGKGEGFRIGLILLPFIFYPLLAFGDSRYLGNLDVPPPVPEPKVPQPSL